MRRLMLLVTVTALALAGCSPGPTGSPSPSVSARMLVLAPQSVGAVHPAVSRCDGPRATVDRAPASTRGPYGSVNVTGSAAIALTFDDGPDPVHTPMMLDVLSECGVRATFCLVGNKVQRHADVVRRIVAEGHTLCNHTWQHNVPLGTYGPQLIREDLQRTNDAIRSVVPDAPISYFRAPGGAWTADYLAVAAELGMTSLNWDVDPWDWNFSVNGRGETMTRHIVTFVQAHVRPGSVILSHDNDKPATVEAYRWLLPWLVARYELVALPPAPLT